MDRRTVSCPDQRSLGPNLARLALWRVSKGHGAFMWVLYAPLLFVLAAGIWVGFQVAVLDAVVGVLIVVVFAITILLLVRLLLHRPSTIDSVDASGDVTKPAFDYVVWTMLGLPIVLGGILVILAIRGG
jgi:hypothetical protein